MLSEADKIARKGLVTGSRIARILGVSPYGGPTSVWREMMEGFELEDSPQLKRGRMLEPAVLAWHAEDAGCVLRNVATTIHPTKTFIGATPDAIATYPSGEERAVEAKTVSWHQAHQWGESGTDRTPEHVICQATFEAGVLGLRATDVPALLGLDDFRQYVIRFDEQLFLMMADHAERFMVDHIQANKPPPPDGTESALEWLDGHFRETRKSVAATEEAERLMVRIKELRGSMKEADAVEMAAIQRIQELMGLEDADAMAGEGWSITWRRPSGRRATDFEAICRELNVPPELIEKHSRITEPKRTFRMNWKEKK